MSSQPPGPGQPWQSAPAPWETSRQPQHGQPQQPQRPMLPQGSQQVPQSPPPVPGHQGGRPARTSIWRVTLGVFLGLWLFFISLVILGAVFKDRFETEFDNYFRDLSLGTSQASTYNGL